MLSKFTQIALATAFAAMMSISATHAGANNVNFAARSPNTIHSLPNLPNVPDVKVKPQLIDARLKVLHCYYTRERNELGVWVRRTHCN